MACPTYMALEAIHLILILINMHVYLLGSMLMKTHLRPTILVHGTQYPLAGFLLKAVIVQS